LDEKTRGTIEKSVDYVLQHNIVPDVEFSRNVIPLKSFEDVVFGYTLGLLKQQIYFMLMMSRDLTEENKKEVDRILVRRIPEIREKIIGELAR
jgi:hypothetical protein